MADVRKRIEQRLNDEIVRTCAEGDVAYCDRWENKKDWPLFRRLDEVIEIVESMRDYSVEPYRSRLREIVCATCNQDETGFCSHRANQECALDVYFPKIVAIIEDELKQQ